MRQVAVLAFVALAGCAGVSPRQDGAAASAEQRAKALKKASDYCKKKGLVMEPAKNADTPTRSGQLAPEVQFRCVKAK